MKTLKFIKKFLCYIFLGLSLTPHVLADGDEQEDQLQNEMMRTYSFEEPNGEDYEVINRSMKGVNMVFIHKADAILNFYLEILDDMRNIFKDNENSLKSMRSLSAAYYKICELNNIIDIYSRNFDLDLERVVYHREECYDLQEGNNIIMKNVVDIYKYLDELIKQNDEFASVRIKWRKNQNDILYFIHNFMLYRMCNLLKIN